MAENDADLPQPSPEELQRLKVFDRIDKLISANPKAIEHPVSILQDGGMEAEQAANLMLNQPHVDLGSLKVGDVLWWTSKSGTTGYFVIEQNKADRGLWGPMRMTDKDGVVKREYAEASIDGASFGGMLLPNRVSVNIPLEYRIPGKINNTDMTDEQFFEAMEREGRDALMPKVYRTSTLTDVGVIKGELVNQDDRETLLNE